MKKIISYIIILLAFNSCNAQNNKKTPFEELLKNVTILNDSFPIITKEYLYKPPTLELTEDDSYKYLKLNREDIYYIEEFYNHDEDIRTYGDEKSCFPIITSKYENNNIIYLFITEYNGFNTGDISNTYLYTFTKKGDRISKIFLRNEMIDLDGLPFTAFCFLNKNYFNTYIYNIKNIDINGKKKQKTYVTLKEYKINNNGEITMLKTLIQDEYLQKGNHQSNNPKKWPSNDPMKLLLKK